MLKEKIAQLGQAGKKLGSDVKTAALNARERMKERAADRKAQAAAKKAFSAEKPIERAASLETIGKDEGGATAALKMGKNLIGGVTRVANIGKRLKGRKVAKDHIDYKKLSKEFNKE